MRSYFLDGNSLDSCPILVVETREDAPRPRDIADLPQKHSDCSTTASETRAALTQQKSNLRGVADLKNVAGMLEAWDGVDHRWRRWL